MTSGKRFPCWHPCVCARDHEQADTSDHPTEDEEPHRELEPLHPSPAEP